MLNQENYETARDFALRSLGMREQTEQQMRQKLIRREYSEEVIEAVIDFLKEYNYLNDERFLEQYIYSHCHKMNRRQLRDRLYVLGFRHVDVDSYLKQYHYDEEALLKKSMQTYICNRDLSDSNTYNKAVSYFMKKGYPFSLIRKNLDIFCCDSQLP